MTAAPVEPVDIVGNNLIIHILGHGGIYLYLYLPIAEYLSRGN